MAPSGLRLAGVLAGRIGGAWFTMPAPSPGAHTFAVRAFNAVDGYSPLVESQRAIA